MLFAIALCGTVMVSGGAEIPGQAETVVHVDGGGLLPERLLWEAQTGTVNIFKHAGIRLAWKGDRHPAAPGCPAVINLFVIASAPEYVSRTALAYAHPPTASIDVFYDRVEPVVQFWPKLAPALLSHIFAHEIAHLLQSLDRHSDTGILKPVWSHDDYLLMLDRQLTFTPLDIALMREGIARSCRNSATE